MVNKTQVIVTRTRCPRCSNKLFIDRDSYGWYETCLCGYQHDLPEPNITTHIPKNNLKI